MSTPHPFSPYVAILGRGKTKQRHYTEAEAEAMMTMILNGEALPEQIGAVMMLLRLKEEAPAEIAGFTRAARKAIKAPQIAVDLDWSSYAGKRVQLPWFILSLCLLAGAGVRVFVHGTEGHTAGRIYTRAVCETLGLPVAGSLDQAGELIDKHGFAFAPLKVFCDELQKLIDLRPIFGLRSPVHSFARMINPLAAPVMMQGIFHRGFMEVHAGAAQLLEQPVMAVFRGEGGEIERRPNKPTPVWTTKGSGEPQQEVWPQVLDDGHQAADPNLYPAVLGAVWRGEVMHDYGIAAALGTAAVALKTLGRVETMAGAEEMAAQLWAGRDKSRMLPGL